MQKTIQKSEDIEVEIQLSEETLARLEKQKIAPGESLDHVLERLLRKLVESKR